MAKKFREMSTKNFHTKTAEGQKMLEDFKKKQDRLLKWVNKLTPEEFKEYKVGMSDQRRYVLRKKYDY